MNKINLDEYANGALSVQINRALETITNNIKDPNTEATAKRKITVTITLAPNQQRDFIAVGVTTKPTLAPELGVVTAMSIGKNLETGEVEAVEIGSQLPGQMQFASEEASEEKEPMVLKKVVDPSTGEIYETPVDSLNVSESSKVVDLRSAREA
jgi:hypothetical protein